MTAYNRDRLVQVIIYHQRMDDTSCACGWGKRPEHLGLSYGEHIADVYEDEDRVADPTPPPETP